MEVQVGVDYPVDGGPARFGLRHDRLQHRALGVEGPVHHLQVELPFVPGDLDDRRRVDPRRVRQEAQGRSVVAEFAEQPGRHVDDLLP